MLALNTPAPDFSLWGDDGHQHSLSTHRDAIVVVYFYPQDNTTGCTKEACDFRDNMSRLTPKGVVVFGISKDSVASHKKFKEKHHLNFTLLADPDTQAHQQYGTWGEKVLYGKKHMGTIRSTFVIDRAGLLAAQWTKVKVPGHVDEVLRVVASM